MSLPELTPEELAYYASLNLDDPDADALADFLAAADAAGPEATHDDRDAAAEVRRARGEAASSRHGTSPMPRGSSTTTTTTTTDGTALSLVRPAPSASPAAATAALAHRRLSAGPRLGVTQLLTTDGLVGGVAGMADAALQTRCVELPGRQLTTTLSIQCFLNVTHVYLQHNALADLDGVELLAQLQVLVVHHNQLTSLAPLKELEHVTYVDASFNRLIGPVEALLREELPCATLQSLDLRHNPFQDTAAPAPQHAYVRAVCAACPALERLDDEDVGGSDTDADAAADAPGDGEPTSSGSSGRASVSGEATREGRGRLGSRRVRSAITAARAAASTPPPPPPAPQLQCDDASSLSADSDADADVESSAAAVAVAEVVAPRPHTASAYRAAALLEEEQARLVHQLRARHAHATAAAAVVGTARCSSASASERGDASPAEAGELVPAFESGDVPDTTTSPTHADAMLLYQNLQYTQSVGQARLQRDVAAHWDDVARVLQTAQALQRDRRRRLQQRLEAATPAYAESLRLLQQESYVPDLSGYRTGAFVTDVRARDATAGAPAPAAAASAAQHPASAMPTPAASRSRAGPDPRRRPPGPPGPPAAARSSPSPARPTAAAPASAPPRPGVTQRASAATLVPRPPPQPRRK